MTMRPSIAARRDLLASLAILGAAFAFALGRPVARRLARHPTRERCAAMLDRYAEHEARARSRAPQAAHIALEAPEVARCTQDLTDEEVECALRSGYADELERCLPQAK
jgi:hypothetical protein